jgi:hypothetical protein
MRMLTTMTNEERFKFKQQAQAVYLEKIALFEKTANATTKSIFKNTPERYKKTWLKSFFGELSPKQAIKAKCFECCGYEDLKENVGDCRSRTCPLWSLRPLQKSTD